MNRDALLIGWRLALHGLEIIPDHAAGLVDWHRLASGQGHR
jgi:hypothetical protein